MPRKTPPRSADHLAALNEIGRIAAQDLDLRPMLQRITDHLSRVFGWEYVELVRIDTEERRFVCEAISTFQPTAIHVGYVQEFGSGIVGEVARTGAPVVADDVQASGRYVEGLPGARSEICVPVRHRGNVVAVLNVETRGMGAFTSQLPFLQAVAEQIAGAIASARLLEETRRHATVLEILAAVSRIATEGGDLGHVLEEIARFVLERFRLALVAVAVPSEDGRGWMHPAFASRDPLPRPEASGLPVATGVVGRALQTGEPQLVLDVHADPDYVPISAGVKAEYSVPIRHRGTVLGALNLETDDPADFSRENVEIFRLVADQVAGALHLASLNARLVSTTEELLGANRRLEQLSLEDPLTGVANRRRFNSALDAEWRRAARTREPLSLLLADVDAFKAYNDRYGHPAGDACLQNVARALRESVRRVSDLVARYGGEEFAVLLPGTPRERALSVAEQMRARVASLRIPHGDSPVTGHLTISVGAATMVPSTLVTPEALIHSADRALYAAKEAGRNRVG